MRLRTPGPRCPLDEVQRRPNELAYIIYTSDSTVRPRAWPSATNICTSSGGRRSVRNPPATPVTRDAIAFGLLRRAIWVPVDVLRPLSVRTPDGAICLAWILGRRSSGRHVTALCGVPTLRGHA